MPANRDIESEDYEEFGDDFEEDGDGVGGGYRITGKDGDMEMSQVMDIYEDFLKKPVGEGGGGGAGAGGGRLSTVGERSFEELDSVGRSPSGYAGHDSIIQSRMAEKRKNMREKLIEKMGKGNFDGIYNCIMTSNQKNVPQSQVSDI